MSEELVIVRHGQCTGNAADRASSKGDHSLFTREVRRQESHKWQLTERGIVESKYAGAWIRQNIAISFDHYLYSDFVRAVETGHHMDFEDALWKENKLLRERKWGGVENLPYPERNEIFHRLGISEHENSMYWRPPNGESMVSVVQRTQRFLQEQREGTTLVVSHGAPIQAIRLIQHGIRADDYPEFISGNNYIRNCQIFHYFGRKNESTNLPTYAFERSVYLDAADKWIETVRELR